MEEFYTVNQAALVLKVHPLTIRRYIKEGKLKAYRAGGNIRISVNDLKSFTQNLAPRAKTPKLQTDQTETVSTKLFSISDPLFKLRARGLSTNKLENI